MKIGLKMSKILLIIGMVSAFISLCMISLSTIKENDESIVEISQEVSSHVHEYSYERISNKHHQLKCACGIVTGEARPHIINAIVNGNKTAKCIECGATLDMNTDIALVVGIDIGQGSHTHDYSYKKINYQHHQLKCSCGEVTGEARPHIINACANGNKTAKCIECGELLDMNTDMALVVGMENEPEKPHTHQYSYVSTGISQHKGYCDCGAVITSKHKFVQVETGQQCIQCGYLVKFNIGLGFGLQ